MKYILYIFSICFTLVANNSISADLSVLITGIKINEGNVGCALFNIENIDSFPMHFEQAELVKLPAKYDEAKCLFTNIENGKYAISVFNDKNNNNIIETNIFGAPKEDWGVSNNVRHSLKPPTFEEASFEIKDSNVTMKINLDN